MAVAQGVGALLQLPSNGMANRPFTVCQVNCSTKSQAFDFFKLAILENFLIYYYVGSIL